ncbi:hypothetical protein HZA42_03885 [Candidatus Peregrinibacteria bacterium]|nr:hypothetical protein [Candidatus Peregrinibacteria bacterium]
MLHKRILSKKEKTFGIVAVFIAFGAFMFTGVSSASTTVGTDITTSGSVTAGSLSITSGFTAYAPVFGGITPTGALQSGTAGTAGQVLTSNGASALPTFQAASGGWTSGDSNAIYNSNSGNVGIGTTTPSEKLQVTGNIRTTGCFKANSWMPVNSGTTSSLLAIGFANSTTGVIASGNSGFLRTTNSGATWSQVASNASRYIRAVAFANSSTGVAVGDSGTILRTADGGATWSSITSGTSNDLRAVAFASSLTGVAVGSGGIILQTANGGATWSLKTSSTINRLSAVAFVNNSETGFAVGDNGTIVKTIDSGATWETVSNNISNSLLGVAFANSNIGIAVGYYGEMVLTTDGGTTWNALVKFTASTLQAVTFVNSTTGFAVGLSNVLMETLDSGITWTTVASGMTGDFFGVAFATSTTGFIVGGTGMLIQQTDNKIIDGNCLDLAELYTSSGSVIEKGSLVSTHVKDGSFVARKSRGAYDDQLLGVVSSDPAIVIEGGSVVMGGPKSSDDNKIPVALAGRVPVRVNLEGGPIEVGDAITSSSVYGVGMKATKSGKIVGYALESWNNKEQGEITVRIVGVVDYTPRSYSKSLEKRIEQLEKLIGK